MSLYIEEKREIGTMDTWFIFKVKSRPKSKYIEMLYGGIFLIEIHI